MELNSVNRTVGFGGKEFEKLRVESFAGNNYALKALGYASAYTDPQLSLAQTLRKYGATPAGVPTEKIDGHETFAIETTILWGSGPDEGKPYYRFE